MTPSEYLAAVNHPGAFTAVEWDSTVRPAAAHKGTVLAKHTVAVVRTGIDFAHLGVNENRETGSLPWGAWDTFPYVIMHKGTFYARLYVSDRPGAVKTTYTVDGQAVERDAFLAYLTPSARKSSRSVGGTITVKLANLRLRQAATAA